MRRSSRQDFRFRISKQNYTIDFSFTCRFAILVVILLLLGIYGFENTSFVFNQGGPLIELARNLLQAT